MSVFASSSYCSACMLSSSLKLVIWSSCCCCWDDCEYDWALNTWARGLAIVDTFIRSLLVAVADGALL